MGKKAVPVKIDKKGPALKDSEFGDRPMTKQEKEEYMRENKARLRREGKLPPSPPRNKNAPSWDMSDNKRSDKGSKSSSSREKSPPSWDMSENKREVKRSEPGPQFHTAVKKSMPPPEKKKEPTSELDREKREIEAKMRELEKKKEEMERKHKVLEENERRRQEF